MNSLILSVAIGLVFSFAVLAAVTSIVTEGIARSLGLRAEYLLRGLRTMLDGGGDFELHVFDPRKPMSPIDPEPWATKVMDHPLIAPSFSQGNSVADPGNRRLTRKERRTLPSYVSARSFAQALVDLLVEDQDGNTTIDRVRAKLTQLPDHLKKPLVSLLNSAGDDIDAFRGELERWYDDQMARVSGWYKRHVRWISLGIALVLVLAFNVSAISIGRALYSDEALRGAVVTAAAQASDCSGDAAACLKKIEDQIAEAKTLGLPLGWTPISRCPTPDVCSAWDAYGLADPDHNGAADVFFFLTVLLGYALMVVSIVPGARFWFDLLGKLGSLRSTGPKPAPST